MTKTQLLKRALPIALSLIAIILIAFSCSAFRSNTILPTISDKNGVYASVGNIEVSNEDVYNSMIDSYGAKELTNMVDTVLLAEFIEQAKNDPSFNVEEEFEKQMFNGLTRAEASENYNASELADLEGDFMDSLIVNGFESVDEYKEILYLNQARILFTRADLMSEYENSSNDEPTLTMGDLESEYENYYYDSACLIKIHFSTLADAGNALIEHGLDVNAEGTLVKAYYDDEGTYVSPEDFVNYPLDPEVLEGLELTDAEILEAYVAIYNDTYGYRDSITYSNGTVLECGSDDLTVTYDGITEDYSNNLANYIFRILDVDRYNPQLENPLPYTEKPVPLPISIDSEGNSKSAYFIMYKVSGDDQNIFRDLFDEMTDEEYEEFLTKKPSSVNAQGNKELIDELVELAFERVSNNNPVIFDRIGNQRLEHELTIFDKYLEQNYRESFGESLTNEGNNNIVFSYLDLDGNKILVTTDEFFDYLSLRYGAIVATSHLNLNIALANEDLFDEAATDERIEEITSTITNYKVRFQQGEFVQYGFDPEQLSWSQFLYSAFQSRSETDLYNLYLKDDVRSLYEIDLFMSDDVVDATYEIMIDYYEKAYTLDIIHMLIYVDNDENTVPDTYIDGNGNWTDYQHVMSLELIDIMRTSINDALDEMDEETEVIDVFNQFAGEYNEASYISDETSENYSEWAKYKQAGILLKVEDLGKVTYGMMVEEFTLEADAMFNTLVEDKLDYLVSDNNVLSRYGYHLMYADNYVENYDAYPEDDTKLYPSKDDVVNFLNNDVEQSDDIVDFLAKYYTLKRNEYVSEYRTLIYDILRASMNGTEFASIEVQAIYDEILVSNQNQFERYNQ